MKIPIRIYYGLGAATVPLAESLSSGKVQARQKWRAKRFLSVNGYQQIDSFNLGTVTKN